MRLINFVCPRCGDGCLTVVQNVVENLEVIGIDEDSEGKYLVPGDVVDSVVENTLYWECAMCGHTVGITEKDVLEWLDHHNMIEDGKPD